MAKKQCYADYFYNHSLRICANLVQWAKFLKVELLYQKKELSVYISMSPTRLSSLRTGTIC